MAASSAALAAAAVASSDMVSAAGGAPSCAPADGARAAPSRDSESESLAPPRDRCEALKVRHAACHGSTTRESKLAQSSAGIVAVREEGSDASRPSNPRCSSTPTTIGQERSGASRLSNV
eukprot:scaffold92847_cov31-Tisochrysis_lutea.AAC.4